MRSTMSLDEAFTSSSPMRTERLFLRRLELDDAGSVFAFKSEPEAARLHGGEPNRDIDQSREWVRQYLADNELRKAITWVIVEREKDEVIGECCLWSIDHEQGCAELGYELRSSHWGRGLMKEALRPVLSFGFHDLGLHRVQAFTLETNGPSRKVLTDLHFQHEGTLRLKVPIGQMFVDELVYGLLREEWEEAFLARGEGIKRVSFFATDLGRMGAAERDGSITNVYLPGELPEGPSAEIGTPLLEEAARQIKEYLSGERKDFDLPMYNEGTDFSTLVWEALRSIPYG